MSLKVVRTSQYIMLPSKLEVKISSHVLTIYLFNHLRLTGLPICVDLFHNIKYLFFSLFYFIYCILCIFWSRLNICVDNWLIKSEDLYKPTVKLKKHKC